MASLTQIREAVEAQKTIVGSVLTLITELSQRLKDALADDDPEAASAVVTELESMSKSMAEAVAANTPAAEGGNTERTAPQPDPA